VYLDEDYENHILGKKLSDEFQKIFSQPFSRGIQACESVDRALSGASAATTPSAGNHV